MTDHTLPIIASTVKDHTAQKLLLNYNQKEINARLTKNPNLDPKIWAKLIKSAPLYYLPGLLRRKLTEDQIQIVLKDKRESALLALFESGIQGISDELAQTLVTRPGFTYYHARAWNKSGKAPESVILQILKKLDQEISADHLIYQQVAPLDKVESILKSSLVFFDKAYILDIRPELIPIFLDKKSWWYMEPLAICRHIFDERMQMKIFTNSLMANQAPSEATRNVAVELLTNPNATPEVLQRVVDFLQSDAQTRKTNQYWIEKKIEFRIKEETANLYKLPIKKDWNTLDDQAKHSLAEYLKQVNPGIDNEDNFKTPSLMQRYPTLDFHNLLTSNRYDDLTLQEVNVKNLTHYDLRYLNRVINDLISPQIAPLGEQAWSLLFQSLPDWNLSLQELVEALKSSITK